MKLWDSTQHAILLLFQFDSIFAYSVNCLMSTKQIQLEYKHFMKLVGIRNRLSLFCAAWDSTVFVLDSVILVLAHSNCLSNSRWIFKPFCLFNTFWKFNTFRAWPALFYFIRPILYFKANYCPLGLHQAFLTTSNSPKYFIAVSHTISAVLSSALHFLDLPNFFTCLPFSLSPSSLFFSFILFLSLSPSSSVLSFALLPQHNLFCSHYVKPIKKNYHYSTIM